MKTNNYNFKETDIRPHYLMNNQKEMYLKDITWLKKQLDCFEKINCPACGSESRFNIFEKYGFNYDQCQVCDTVFLNPRPNETLLERYYDRSENSKYWNKYIFPSSEAVRRQKIFKPRAKKVIEISKTYDAQPEIMLEIGSGFGTFCEEVSKQDFFKRIIAVEPSPELAQTCRDRNLEVIQKPIEKITLSNINVIVSFEVIEHIFNPKQILEICYRMLVPRGLVLITCPNYKGFDIMTLKNISDSIDIEHLNYFNPDSIKHLFQLCNFRILDITTPGHLDADIVRNKVLNNEYSLTDDIFLKTILIDKWDELGAPFQKFLRDNNLSSHMWVTAQKI